MHYVVIFSDSTLDYAEKNEIPRSELVEQPCVNCGVPLYLTKAQYEAYQSDDYIQSLGEQPAFACPSCDRARKEAQRSGEYN